MKQFTINTNAYEFVNITAQVESVVRESGVVERNAPTMVATQSLSYPP